jgi:hypothetical protein
LKSFRSVREMLVVVLFVNLRSRTRDVLLPTSFYTESKKSLLVLKRLQRKH